MKTIVLIVGLTFFCVFSFGQFLAPKSEKIGNDWLTSGGKTAAGAGSQAIITISGGFIDAPPLNTQPHGGNLKLESGSGMTSGDITLLAPSGGSYSGKIFLKLGNGTSLEFRQGVLNTNAIIYTPKILDFDNNGYFLDPNSTTVSLKVAGSVCIGTTNAYGYKLAVNGSINCTEVNVTGTVPASDFVFKTDYELRSLKDLEAFVNEKQHLPDVPSAEEFKNNGYKVGEMDDILLRKVEELTLYIIEQNKQMLELKSIIERNGLK